MKIKTLRSSHAEIVTALAVDKDILFNEFTNPMSYSTFHPLITKVDKMENGKYLFHECISLFFIPYRFSYSVDIEHFTDCKTIMMAEVQKGVMLKLTFEKKQIDSSSFLTERIEAFGPFLFRRILLSKVCQAHKEMINNILRKAIDQNATSELIIS